MMEVCGLCIGFYHVESTAELYSNEIGEFNEHLVGKSVFFFFSQQYIDLDDLGTVLLRSVITKKKERGSAIDIDSRL